MRALTLESSLITGIPLAGTDFVLTPEAIADRVASRLSADPARGHEMTFLIHCPELRPARGAGVHATAARPRAARAPDADDRELAGYLYFRRNVNGWQTEWWLHRDGCRRWFLAERTHLDERDPPHVLAGGARGGSRVTERLQEAPGEGDPSRPARLDRLRGTQDRRVRGRHRRVRARRGRRHDHGAVLQVPPAAGSAVHDGVLCELPDADRRDPQRPRVHRARARRHASWSGRTPGRPPAGTSTAGSTRSRS